LTQPTLEIISDTEADIVKGPARWKLKGGAARQIIAAWCHCRDHAGTGETDAALYLWGLTHGLHHAALTPAQETIERCRKARDPE
jgi:hypothetical protein